MQLHRLLPCLTLPLLLASLNAASPPARLAIPAEDIARSGLLRRAAISPNGTHAGAVIAGKDDVHDLLIVNLTDNSHTGLRGKSNFEVYNFQWLDDDQIVFNVWRQKTYAWGLFTAHLDRLERHEPIRNFDVTRIIGVPRSQPKHVLVWLKNSAEQKGGPGPLLELDASRADRPKINKPGSIIEQTIHPPRPGVAIDWKADQNGELSLCLTYFEGEIQLFRYSAGNEWRKLPFPAGTKAMEVDGDNQFLWVVTHSPQEGYALRRYNLNTGALEEAVHRDADFDLSTAQLHFSQRTHKLIGLHYDQRRTRSVWFDPDIAAIHAGVNQLYPHTDTILIDHDKADRKFLFLVRSPEEPGLVLLADVEKQSITRFVDLAPWLRKHSFVATQPISFKSRDGIKLEGYLTLPAGADREHPVPLIVIVHGGPWSRETWSFDSQVQFLASRGYAVLQPNYRGSTGYGPVISAVDPFDFQRMHDDVSAATRAIVRSGMVDPQRIAIMGGGFGGYLALAGLASGDNPYRCGASLGATFEFDDVLAYKKYYGSPGDYDRLTDEARRSKHARKNMEELSALEHPERITVPVLVAGYTNYTEGEKYSRRLTSVLKKRGVPYQTFSRRDEGLFSSYGYKDMVDYLHCLETFLAENLGGVSLAPATKAP